jgi:hypothetical protein
MIFIFLLFAQLDLPSPEALQKMWEYAKSIGGIEAPRPSIEVKNLNNHQIAGRADTDNYRVLLDSNIFIFPMNGFLEFTITHEFIHLALIKKGIPIDAQHCYMMRQHVQLGLARWISERFIKSLYLGRPLMQGAVRWEWEQRMICEQGGP